MNPIIATVKPQKNVNAVLLYRIFEIVSFISMILMSFSIILQNPFPHKIFLGVIQINDHIRYKVFIVQKSLIDSCEVFAACSYQSRCVRKNRIQDVAVIAWIGTGSLSDYDSDTVVSCCGQEHLRTAQ